MNLKYLKFKLQANKMLKMVLKHPPKGQEIKEYIFKKLTNDLFFAVNVKLESKDIGLIQGDKEGTFKAYLISELKAAKERMRQAECWAMLDLIEEKYFREYLKSKNMFWSDTTIRYTVKGMCGFDSKEIHTYRDYMCTSFSTQARDEYEKWKKESAKNS